MDCVSSGFSSPSPCIHFSLTVSWASFREEVVLFSPLKRAKALKQLPSWFHCLVAEGALESPAFHRQANEYCKVGLHTVRDE